MMVTVRNVELNKIDNQILSAVSHDLRAPLAAIKGYSTMLYDYLPKLSLEETKEYIRSIDNAADRLNKIVGNILDTSCLETGAFKLEIVSVDIVQLIKTAVAEAAAGEDHCEIVIKAGSNLTRIFVDPRRILQVMDNLIENAARRSPPDAKILISANNNGEGLTISVTDWGPEIPASEHDNIFDLMGGTNHESSTTARVCRLGLYICRRLVEAHGGRIQVTSAVGQGNTIQFSLPSTTINHTRKYNGILK